MLACEYCSFVRRDGAINLQKFCHFLFYVGEARVSFVLVLS